MWLCSFLFCVPFLAGSWIKKQQTNRRLAPIGLFYVKNI